jgi:hypothetical protein
MNLSIMELRVGHKAKWLRALKACSPHIGAEPAAEPADPVRRGQYFIGNAGSANSKGLEVETGIIRFLWWIIRHSWLYAYALPGGSSAQCKSGVSRVMETLLHADIQYEYGHSALGSLLL